jgi:hypothetical protein
MAASSSSGLPVGRLDDGLPDVDMDEAIEARCVCVCVCCCFSGLAWNGRS